MRASQVEETLTEEKSEIPGNKKLGLGIDQDSLGLDELQMLRDW